MQIVFSFANGPTVHCSQFQKAIQTDFLYNFLTQEQTESERGGGKRKQESVFQYPDEKREEVE